MMYTIGAVENFKLCIENLDIPVNYNVKLWFRYKLRFCKTKMITYV